MGRLAKLSIILLRVATGWYFLYQGIRAILNPTWSLAPFIQNSNYFPSIYTALLSPTTVPYVSYLVKGLFLAVGGLLILGLFVRTASCVGIILTLLFYFPLLKFPYVTDQTGTYYILDSHLMMAVVLFTLFATRAGEFFGLGTMFRFSRY